MEAHDNSLWEGWESDSILQATVHQHAQVENALLMVLVNDAVADMARLLPRLLALTRAPTKRMKAHDNSLWDCWESGSILQATVR